ncbi:hypothetical protein Brms1b_005381 [Colletotrichum noveboracense]|nr:hypothetical protein COL940_005765 [Colletotrichum noveboracense]KAJ0316661.1 hypothetical protein Brms1b_005381 [Colletotrichum noveboracense]
MEGNGLVFASHHDHHVALHYPLHACYGAQDHPLVIGSCVTCTDPILSQAIAKGPFADKFVARPLREIISSEAGANDGFGMLPSVSLSALAPLWLVGICGMLGTDDLLACFVAGNAMNWDGEFLAETEKRHDEVNSCVDVLLNFGGFMYIGTIMPWDQFNQPDVTGLTYGRLFALGGLVILFRRIPAILMCYKIMPKVCQNWKEALFMGYFGPIGAGAVFYVEHTRHLFPELGEGDEEETNLVRVMVPVVYWLVLFSIVVHGLSIPALNLIYKYAGVKPIQEDAVELRRVSMHVPTPKNATVGDRDTFIAYNRFSRPVFNTAELPYLTNNQKMYTHDEKSFNSLGK